MFINFDNALEVTFSVFLGNQLIQQNTIAAPMFFIEQQFMSLVQQVASQKQPMRVLMEREETIWDPFEQKQKVIPCSMEFRNYSIPEDEETAADR